MTVAVSATGPDPTDLTRYAGFVSRVGAAIVDVVVFSILSGGTLLFLQAFYALVTSVPFGDVTIEPELATTVISFLTIIYFAGCWTITGRTAGEAIFGLRVIRPDGRRVRFLRALLRCFATFLSLAFCGLGFAWILVDRRRRSWHDIIAGTVVIYSFGRIDEVAAVEHTATSG
jgi:uncharacterized RDD family membrane protein YckC